MLEMTLVFVVLGTTILLFVSDRMRLDLVAVLALLALMLSGVISTEEALAGFSNSIVLIIAGLFVVGAGLFQTGVANYLGAWLLRVAGTSEVRIIAYIMLIVAVLSAFMSSTGAVAVLLPVVVSLAGDAQLSSSKLLMPLAFGALIGGMLTLIGTPPNIVVSEQLASIGYEPFGFFEFTPIGAAVLIVGIIFMLIAGRHMLPERTRLLPGRSVPAMTLKQLAEPYEMTRNLYRLRVRRASPLVGRTLAESQLGEQYRVQVLETQAWPDEESPPHLSLQADPEKVLDAHDILLVQGEDSDVARACRELDLGRRPREEGKRRLSVREIGMAEVLVRSRSHLIGQTLRQARFRNRYNVSVLGMIRRGSVVHEDFSSTPLRFGDSLLVEGAWEDIDSLSAELNDFVVVNKPREMAEQLHTPRNALVSIAIVAAMLVLMVTGVLPTVTTVLLAAVAMILSGCVSIDDVYTVINWESLILIAAMLPMATALENTGGIEYVADILTESLGAYGPYAIMVALYLITAFFSQFISNTATTVLLAPVAAQAAVGMGAEPHAFLMTVAIAASAAFSTPIASPVNTLVLGPGAYRFGDFVRVGVPLQILVLIVALVLVPLLFPL